MDSPFAGDQEMTRPDIPSLVTRLLGPPGPEIGCDACFDELDRCVELQLLGRSADEAVPGMSAHLAGCPACREDFDSLLALAGVSSYFPRKK